MPVASHSKTGIHVRALQMPRWATRSLPIVFAYLPIAFTFGLGARGAGLGFLETVAMSVFVYAGAAQMIAVGLLATGQPISVVLVTTFMVNLRMLLLGAAIAPRVGHWPRSLRCLFGFQLTDETFATFSSDPEPSPMHPTPSFKTHALVHFSWVLGSGLGHRLSQLVVDLKPYGLDFALPGMLIGMSCLLVRRRSHLFIGLLAAVIALSAVACGLGTWAVLLATLIAPTIGLYLSQTGRGSCNAGAKNGN